MDRSIGFEKTLQVNQYEPVKVSTYINSIPFELWSNVSFVKDLYNLILSQSYQLLISERDFNKQLKESENPLALLSELENQALDNLKSYVINISIEEKKND